MVRAWFEIALWKRILLALAAGVVVGSLLGESVMSFHETLHVPRLVSPLVQAMLPWRMPRRG